MFSTSTVVLKDLSTKGTDEVDYLLLNENNLQQGKEETLVLIDDQDYELDGPFECQSSDHLQESNMEEAYKAKHEDSLPENIDGIWKKVR